MLVQLYKIPPARHMLHQFIMHAAVRFKQRLPDVTFELEFSDPNNRAYCSRWLELHARILLRQAECSRIPSSLLALRVFNCERFYVFLYIHIGSPLLEFSSYSSGSKAVNPHFSFRISLFASVFPPLLNTP